MDGGGDCDGNCVDGSSYGAKYAQMCLTCVAGYKYTSTYNDCTLTCGEHSSNSDADTCKCESGWGTPDNKTSYTNAGGACTIDRIVCGNHSSNNADNQLQCDCEDGYYYAEGGELFITYTSPEGYCKHLSSIFTPTSEVYNFSSTSINTWTVPAAGYYKFEVWGGQGGSYGGYIGGYGGYSSGIMKLESGEMLYIVVGGTGSWNSSGGYNGGGSGGATSVSNGGGGGGATHIATKTGLLSSLSSNEDKAHVLIVAGGGGGASYSSYYKSHGGQGGGIEGGQGHQSYSTYYGYGGTQTEGGKGNTGGGACTPITGYFGQGGCSSTGPGGGGGWYGGGGAHVAGAGGGSGYLNILKLLSGTYSMYCYNGATTHATTACGTGTNSTTGPNVSETAQANYAKSGNGYARITLLSVD